MASKWIRLLCSGEFELVIKLTDEELQRDSRHSKSYYFKGKALAQLGRYDEAVGYICHALLC